MGAADLLGAKLEFVELTMHPADAAGIDVVDHHPDPFALNILIGHATAEETGLLPQVELPFDTDAAVQDPADILEQVVVGADGLEVAQVTPDVLGQQVEDLGGAGGEQAHAVIAVDEDGRRIRGLHQVAQIAGHPVQLLDLELMLGVDAVQLLIDRMQFLVGALQLLVGGEEFLVGGLELLVAGLQLLDRGLHRLPGALQLQLQFADIVRHLGADAEIVGDLHRLCHRCRRSLLVEQDHVAGASGGPIAQGLDPHLQALLPALPPLDDQVWHPHRLALLGAVAQGGGQGEAQGVAGQQGQEVAIEATRAGGEEAGGIAEDVQNLVLFVDQKTRGDETVEEGVVDAIEQHPGGGHAPRTRIGALIQRGPQGGQGAALAMLAIELPLAIEGLELVRQAAQGLAGAEEEGAVEAQGIVEVGDGLGLGVGQQIDEQIATTDQVDLGEGGILEQVVHGEHQGLAEMGQHLPAALAQGLEIGGAQPLRDLGQGLVTVDALGGDLDGLFMQIGGQDLDQGCPPLVAEGLMEEDGQAVGLLARGAATDPDPHLLTRRGLIEDGGNDLVPQHLEGLGVTEEAGDADQQVLVEQVELVGIVGQAPGVVLDVGVAQVQGQPPGNAAGDGGRLIAGEIDVVGPVEQVQDRRHAPERPLLVAHAMHGAQGLRIGGEFHQGLGHVLGHEDGIHAAGVDGALGHAVKACRLGGFHQHQAAGVVDVKQPAAAVGTGAREDDARRTLPPGGGQGAEEGIDR